MIKASDRLEEESQRNARLCDPTSHEKIISVCQQEFISAHMSEIVAEVHSILEQEKIQDCRLTYSLLSRVEGGIPELLEIFKTFIADAGKAIVARLAATVAKDPREYAEHLMALHSKYMDYARDVFSGDLLFTAAVDQAFRVIVNNPSVIPGTNAAEVLARYFDVLLKKSAKGFPESEVEVKLAQMIVLFKYIDDKDVFQKFYSRMLAKRLIHGTSLSDDAEMSMISRLKTACGIEYTTKLQRMFTDTALSGDLNASFGKYTQENSLKLGGKVNCLTLHQPSG
ncbi:Cullin-2 [Thoreauomyces humboldtii]|nr:Cullin-2 [Thoreauomyces humboldtii]